MIGHFNPEMPEVLTVTDRNFKNAFTVERSRKPRFIRQPGDEVLLNEERSKASAHSSYQKARYRVLKTKFEPKFRANLVAPPIKALGQEIERQQTQIQSRRSEQETLQRTAHGLLEVL